MIAFIVGTGRCGTTILAQILNVHSMICVPPELQFLCEYSQNGERLHEVFASGKNENFNAADYISLIGERCPKQFDLYFDYKSYFEGQKYPIRNLKSLANDLFFRIAETKGKSIFVEHTPWYGQRIDILNSLFPKAKYIHVVRDGRDVAISYAKTPWWHKDLAANLDRWAYEALNIAESAKNILAPEQMLLVKYEELVQDPEQYLRIICEHLGVEFERNMMRPENYENYAKYRKEGAAHAKPSAALENWRLNKVGPFFSSNAYAWRSQSQNAFKQISSNAKNALQYFGY
jgi:hypothetical protein